MKKYTIKTLADLDGVASKLIADFGKNRVIAFYGEMGVGKTTLIKKICEKLGVKEITSSPTFSIVNEYKTADNNTIYHFDFYRIKTATEVLDLGYEDYFYSRNYCFIEWPEKISNLLPLNAVKVQLILDNDDFRLISFF